MAEGRVKEHEHDEELEQLNGVVKDMLFGSSWYQGCEFNVDWTKVIRCCKMIFKKYCSSQAAQYSQRV